jgi:MFS transporter, OCT family, solute carrier family 22 (organic cation transporter), member 4/5
MVSSLIGKTLITLAYTVVYLYGSEIFPTEVRNTGLATAAVSECVGGMVAPAIGGPLVCNALISFVYRNSFH